MTRSAPAHPFDTALVARRMARLGGARGMPMPDFLHRRGLAELILRLEEMDETFGRAVVCATAPDDAARMLAACKRVKTAVHARPWAAPAGHAGELIVDPERLPLAAASLDLFVSVLDLALVNDLPAALRSIRMALRPGGLFMGVMPGGESLRELRAAWALADSERFGEPGLRVIPFCGLRQVGGLLQMAGFIRPVADMEALALRHDSALSLMYELKSMGWANPLAGRPRVPVSRGLLARAAAYCESAAQDADGRVRTNIELIYLCGRAAGERRASPGRGAATGQGCPVPPARE